MPRTSVDLPEPFGPSSATTSPGSTTRSMPLITGRRSYPIDAPPEAHERRSRHENDPHSQLQRLSRLRSASGASATGDSRMAKPDLRSRSQCHVWARNE